MIKILKIKEWLKFSKPDYDGFLEHVKTWEEEGIPYSFKDLIRLAKNYNTPLPKFDNTGNMVFDFYI